MNSQVNIRMPDKLLDSAKDYAKQYGYGNIQDLIKETLREKIFEASSISKEEFELVKKLITASEKENLYGTEEDLIKRLRGR